jgi:hypothetical protein
VAGEGQSMAAVVVAAATGWATKCRVSESGCGRPCMCSIWLTYDGSDPAVASYFLTYISPDPAVVS